MATTGPERCSRTQTSKKSGQCCQTTSNNIAHYSSTLFAREGTSNRCHPSLGGLKIHRLSPSPEPLVFAHALWLYFKCYRTYASYRILEVKDKIDQLGRLPWWILSNVSSKRTLCCEICAQTGALCADKNLPSSSK